MFDQYKMVAKYEKLRVFRSDKVEGDVADEVFIHRYAKNPDADGRCIEDEDEYTKVLR